MPKEETLENSVRNLSISRDYLIMQIPDNRSMKTHNISIPIFRDNQTFINSIVKAFEDGKQIKFKGEYRTLSSMMAYIRHIFISVCCTDIHSDIDIFKITRYWGNLIINDETYNLRGSYNKYGPLSPLTVAISKNY